MKELSYSELNKRMGRIGITAYNITNTPEQKKSFIKRFKNLEQVWIKRYRPVTIKRKTVEQLKLF